VACAAHPAAEDSRCGRRASHPGGEGLGSLSVPRGVRAGLRPERGCASGGDGEAQGDSVRHAGDGAGAAGAAAGYTTAAAAAMRAGPGLTRGLLQRPAETGA